MDQKRRPIRRRVQQVILRISLAVLLITSVAGIFYMMSIRKQSADALTQQLEVNLKNISSDKASFADAELGKFKEYVTNYAKLISDMFRHPENYVGREIYPPQAENKGKLTMQRYLSDESVSLEDVRGEMELLANLEPYWKATVDMNASVITTIYLGTENGLHVSFDSASDLGVEEGSEESHFNYFEKDWYVRAKESRSAGFTDIYYDAYGRGLTVSCYAPFTDQNGLFRGVVCMDMLITDIYRQIVSMDLGEAGRVYLVDSGGFTVDEKSGEEVFHVMDMISDETVLEDIMNQKNGFQLSDNGTYYAYAPVDATDGELCISIPRDAVLQSVNDINKRILGAILTYLLILAGLAAFALLISRRFAQSLTDPLIALGNDTVKISEGDLDFRAKVQSNDEIGDLAIRFNDMAGSLKQYIEDLTKVTAEKERIGAELNVATQIQANMLPRIFPAFPDRSEFDVYATMTPAKEVGGDFYDYFLIDDMHIALVMADVSGKGVPAALFMVIAKTLIKNRAQMGGTPSEILADVNAQLCEGNEAGLFVTVWLGIIDIRTGKGMAANAGHEHPALRRGKGTFEMIKYKHSPAVATMDGIPFREHEFELVPGDALFVYTDGVTEATDADLQLFGEERTVLALNKMPNGTPVEILQTVKQEIDTFVGDAFQFDDITMLCFEYHGMDAAETGEGADA